MLDPGARGVERALLLRLRSDDVTLFTDGPAQLEPADAGRLAEAGVEVDERAALAAPGPILADAVEVDSTFETSVPGLYAAGDVGTQMPSVAGAIASGHGAAAAIVHALLADVYGAVGAAAEDPPEPRAPGRRGASGLIAYKKAHAARLAAQPA